MTNATFNDQRLTNLMSNTRNIIPIFPSIPLFFNKGALVYIDSNKILAYCDGQIWHLIDDSVIVDQKQIFERVNGATPIIRYNTTNPSITNTESFLVCSTSMDDIPLEPSKDVRMFFDKNKGAFRAGTATSTQWNDVNRGFNSFGCGLDNISSGIRSFSCGNLNIASGTNSHAEGLSTIASNTNAHSEGNLTQASGTSSHAEGISTRSIGTNSHSEGSTTFAVVTNSHAEGSGTVAAGTNSHSEGNTTTSSSSQGHTEGTNTFVSGTSAHAEGNSTQATSNFAHSEGSITVASNPQSHAGGLQARTNFVSEFCRADGQISSTGDSKMSIIVLKRQLTNAVVATPLFNSLGTSTTFPSSTSWTVFVQVSGIRPSVTTDTRQETRIVHFSVSNLAVLTIQGTASLLATSSGAGAGWTVTFTSSGAILNVNVTNAGAGVTVKWTATLYMTRVG